MSRSGENINHAPPDTSAFYLAVIVPLENETASETMLRESALDLCRAGNLARGIQLYSSIAISRAGNPAQQRNIIGSEVPAAAATATAAAPEKTKETAAGTQAAYRTFKNPAGMEYFVAEDPDTPGQYVCSRAGDASWQPLPEAWYPSAGLDHKRNCTEFIKVCLLMDVFNVQV